MRQNFVNTVLRRLIAGRKLDTEHKLLAVCAAEAELDLFLGLGFHDVTLSSLGSQAVTGEAVRSGNIVLQDAMNLGYPSGSFDFAFVSDGLHHCESPHRALLEMYRVARKGVIVFESRDSLAMRLAARLGLTGNYELIAVKSNGGVAGGVNNSDIPNHVYRWTEREFEKTIRSYDPTGPQSFEYFYGLSLPGQPANPVASAAMRLASAAGSLFTIPIKRQRNSFAMVAIKPDPSSHWPWLERRDGALHFDRALVSDPTPPARLRRSEMSHVRGSRR